MPPTDSPLFNPFNRWPFTSSSPNGPTLLPSISARCSCGGIAGPDCIQCGTGYLHRYSATRDYLDGCAEGSSKNDKDATFSPATEATPSRKPLSAADSLRAASLKAFSQNQPKDDTKRVTSAPNCLESGFFNKDGDIEPPSALAPKSSSGINRLAGLKDLTLDTAVAGTAKDSWDGRKDSLSAATRKTDSTFLSPGSQGSSAPTSWRNSLASTSPTTVSPAEGDTNSSGINKNIWNTFPSNKSSQASARSAGAEASSSLASSAKASAQDTTEQRPKTSSSSKTSGPLGCTKCVFEPRLKVIPCGHLICLECGGKYWGIVSSGREVYCGCDDRVLSMVNLTSKDPPGLPKPKSAQSKSGVYPVADFMLSPARPSNPMQFPMPSPIRPQGLAWPNERMLVKAQPVPVPVAVPVPVIPTVGPPAQFASNIHASFPGAANLSMNRLAMMDAETAIQNAPFVELGRHSLAQNWSCVKIGNIPYNITSEEIVEFLGKNANIAPEPAGSMGVHVIMDRSTGKTMDAYVEFVSAKDAWRCASRRRSRVLGNRHLTLEVVDQSELMKDIFPRAKGVVWDGVIPRASNDNSEFGARKPEIVGREELVLIVNHARTPHRSPFSRKCLQRPFQSLMSTVTKFPWFAVNLYTLQQRDYIFQAVLSVVDILKRQIKRGKVMPNLDLDLLKNLVRVGVTCAGFTDAQKCELIKTAEFGADGILMDTELGIFAGFEALAKAPGVEQRVFDMYSLLIEMSMSPLISEPTAQGNAALELFKLKSASKQPDENDEKTKLTMADAAALEWMIVERAVRTVLPGKLPFVKNLTKTGTTGTGLWRDRQQLQ